MSMRPQDLNFGGGEASESLLSPENQVPAPPIFQTVEEIRQELADTKKLYDDTKLGFGNTKLVQYKSQTQLDSAKTQAFKLINETIPQKLKLRKDWETKYSAKRLQLFGSDTELMTAQEVFDTQQLLKNATNTTDPELQAYDQAVARVDELKTKFTTSGTAESQLTGSEQQLALAAAWKQVIPTITDKVKQLRAKNLPTVLGKYGDLGTLTNFVPVTDVEKNVGTAISEANKLAEVEFSTEQVEATDKFGRPTSYTRLRDQEQSNQLSRFLDRSKKVSTATPQEAAALVSVQVGAPTSAMAAKEGGTQNVVPAPVTATSKINNLKASTVTAPTKATTAGPPGVRGGLVIPTVTTTPTGGGGGGGGGTGAGVTPPVRLKAVSPDAWKDILRQTFPSYTNEWLSDNASTHFGPDLVALMVEASKPNGKYQGLTTDEGRQAYALAIKQTVYYQTTETNARDFDQQTTANKQSLVNKKKLEISDAYGDIGFDDATLTALATDAARKGVTGLGLKQAVYSGTFKQQAAQPALANRALEGADADRIRQLGRAWNTKISDDQIKSILTNAPMAGSGLVLTEEGLRQQLQSKWKGAMPHLASQFDAGLTLEDIGSTYREYAAQLLEQTPDQINMFDGPYLQAFGSQESGQLSLTDWTKKVKSDPSFGWQYTKQANDQATDIGLTLARAFGKVA
jgi:hypothetical protein